jgi:ribosomal protein L7/L12
VPSCANRLILLPASEPCQKIQAIKAYRDETGAGLAEAKDAVETFINSL